MSLLADLAVLCFAGLVFSAAVSDILTLTIPNRLCLAVGLLYPSYVLAAPVPVDWVGAVAVAAVALVVGITIFCFGLAGGGDGKLFAVTALWAGPGMIMHLTLYTALAGGVMAIFIWLQHRVARARTMPPGSALPVDPDFGKQPMPYGAAIAVGALYVAFTLLGVN